MMNQRKSGARSTQLRTEANRLYVQKKFFDALLQYNESLCCAEAESENMGLAYANRSAVYFEMKLYDKCLENIELAKRNHYPEKNIEVLKKRESKCLDLMEQQREVGQQSAEAWNFFQLSYPANKNFPNAVDCLELKNDEKYGRHVVTNRPLRVGDVIAIDEPTSKVIKADSRYSTCFETNAFQRCGNCLQENLLSLVPCLSCCKTMYCSLDCMNTAQQRHHQIECEIIDELLASGIVHIVVRMFLEGLSLFDDDIHELETYLNQREETVTVFDLFNCKSSDEKENRRNQFYAAVSLAPDKRKFSLDEYEKIFEKTEKLKTLWNSNETFIRKVIHKLHELGICYIHGIGSWSLKESIGIEQNKPSFYQQLIGHGCFLFCSLLNHSCAPNIKRLNVDDKVVVIVSRPIPEGAQLFDSYRPHFNAQPKAQRQEALLQDYGFACDCDACSNDWPMNENLKRLNDEVLEFARAAYQELPSLTTADAREKLRSYCEMMELNHEHFPSIELIVLQECIFHCLIAITKPAFQFP